MSTLVVIPARMQATRLPGKPLALIGGVPMIVHVWRRAMEAAVGDVVVACDGTEIADAVTAAGGRAIITDPNHPSGSDRVWEAVGKVGIGSQDLGFREVMATDMGTKPLPLNPESRILTPNIILNLQGDVPTLEPRLLRELVAVLDDPTIDIATLAAPITRAEEHANPAVVKAVLTGDGTTARALYFTRCAAPYGEGTRYHHIGVYAYRYAALARFVALPPSPLELREKLEQLRALEAGMTLGVRVVDTVPLGVDTPEDLERARAVLGAGG